MKYDDICENDVAPFDDDYDHAVGTDEIILLTC